MKRLFFVLTLVIPAWICSGAQKKEIAQAQTYIKSGKSLDKAETEMRKLLADSANRQNMKIWTVLSDAVRMQYEQGNEQLYLKQSYDTAKLFLTCKRMFQTFEAMDSVDAAPDGKGNVRIRYRKRNAEYLKPLRRNLYNGGVYFISKQNFGDAYDMLDCYLDCAVQPLFSHYKYGTDSSYALSASYLATYCGVRLGDTARALKHSSKALQYKPGREKTLQYLANIYQEKKDAAAYFETLKTGFGEYPTSEYFFTRLVDYYNSANMADSSLLVVDRALRADSTNLLFLYGKSNIMLNTGKYKECITLCDQIIARNDSVADAYYNAGVAYINLAFDAEKSGGKKGRALMAKYYKSALPYMERYRQLAPEQKDKWAAALYNIYLNLNMGKEFEKITNVLQN